ncbi:MAG TPA: elongation factor G [Gemmatimonadota bacterium]|nr:elongation factor G [Gemmatimonadota bacterium]
MKVYESQNIRNLAVIGHGGSGKTTLVNAMAWLAGSCTRMGSVEDGNALTDFTPDEIEHQISINLALAFAEYMDTRINLIDTPGYLDFVGEVKAGLRVADAACLVVNAVAGVEVGTERVWEYAAAENLPRLVFVSMMDKEHADFQSVYRQIRETLSDRAIPVEIPIGQGTDFHGLCNLFSEKAHLYKPGTKGEREEGEIPDEVRGEYDRYRQELIETVAETDDTLIERYLEGEQLSREEVLAAMKAGMMKRELFPVFCGSAFELHGVRSLLQKVVELVPNPTERPEIRATRPGADEKVFIAPNAASPTSALIFKTTTEPHVGELSYFRVFSGKVASGADLANATRNHDERLAHIGIMQGKDRTEIPYLMSGDIGVVPKLKGTHTGDTLCARERPVVLRGVDFPTPVISVAIEPDKEGEEEKIGNALAKLHEEDPTFVHAYNPELGQTIIRGMGELHLQVVLERMERKFNVKAHMKQPRIAYRETIRRRAEAQGRYKKQTGGRGQFGDCWIRLIPQSRGEGYAFVNQITGGAIPQKFIPAVDKGIQEALEKGVLAGYPVVDCRVELYDGSYHTVDSSEMAFKIAGSIAFQNASERADPVILEPIMDVTVITPDEYLGDVIGDLNQRRGRILGMEPAGGGKQKIQAQVPQAELYRYSTNLRSLTQGRGDHARTFRGYEEVPHHIAEKIVAEAEEERAGAGIRH